MADLTVTATQVLAGTDAQLGYGTAGASITAGQVVYLDPTTSTYKLFDANDTTANTRAPVIAMNSCSSGQRLTVQTGGSLTIGAGAAPTAGLVYVASATPGGIAPNADVVTGWRVAIIGVATSASAIKLMLGNSGATK
jgi:hypothetical protein